MTKETRLKIIEEPNVIDDHLLDIIGNEFKFDHDKGLAEWLKNSVDAHIRLGLPDSEQFVIFRFTDGTKDDAGFECIDFVGMEEEDIQKAFKRWGDPEAAKRGLNRRVYGGHGNGGKFYMRQMFRRSHFVTYKKGAINIFGFNENRKYGFADGYKNKKVKPEEALEIAGIKKLNFPKGVKDAILAGKRGFTVVRGVGPAKMRNLVKFDKLTEKLKNHPQARRIMQRINVWAGHNDASDYMLLKPDDIKPLPDFEAVRTVEVPKSLPSQEDGDPISVEMSDKIYGTGKLTLRTSEEAFGKGSRGADLNRVDIVGGIGVIASYPLFELGVITWPQASFIYGECECPILEDPEMDAVKNDRSKLVPTPRSTALLAWIREKVDEYAREIADKERKEQEEQRKQISAEYNDFLNRWKDKFMSKFMSDLLHGSGGETENGGGGGQIKKILEPPENGFAFSVPEAEISSGKEERITLKASVPKPVPLGTVVRLESSTKEITCLENKITVRAENVKTTPDGETVAVVNVLVRGGKVGSEGKLKAVAGKLETTVILRVVQPSAEKSKKPKTPQVLLSGIHPDPLKLAPGGTVTLTERDPVVYQRYQDVQGAIYWINTQSPLAKAILANDGDESLRWRDYLFQRYVDIFTKQALYELQRKDPEGFRAERIDSDILDTLTRKVHAAAGADLSSFLFTENFEPQNQEE